MAFEKWRKFVRKVNQTVDAARKHKTGHGVVLPGFSSLLGLQQEARQQIAEAYQNPYLSNRVEAHPRNRCVVMPVRQEDSPTFCS